jgi:excinuclease ABC subunit B
VQEIQDLENILKEIELEMNEYVDKLTKEWKQLEASRIKKRVSYDIRMIKETWFTQWIENYSVYFDKRNPWEPPTTIFDYFPEDCLVIVDESHMSLPQLRAMPQADRSRKINLIDHWFRLPSARDHRPLNFTELEIILQRKTIKDNPTLSKELAIFLNKKIKPDAKTLFVSATPAPYELELNPTIVQQIIRPTWLLDPFTYIYPKSGDYELLLNSVDKLLQKKPYLEKFFDWYSDHVEKIFDANNVEEKE